MTKSRDRWSRRKFLGNLGVAGGALMLNPFVALTVDDPDPRVARIVATTMGIDTHNHIDLPFSAAEIPGPSINIANNIKNSGLSAICMTFAVDRPQLREPGDAYARFKNAMKSLDHQLSESQLKRCLNITDLQASYKHKQPAVIQSIEGGHFLEGRIERLEEAYHIGLRHFGLLHDNDANVPLGDVYTNPPKYGGLTAFGAETIRECNRLGILIDLAHANMETVTAALKIAEHPVVISHTGLNTQTGKNAAMANMMKPRLISKEQAKLVADAGGLIGVWTHLAETPLEYAQNIRALVDIIGVNHVCIGTDTKMTASYNSAAGQQQSQPPRPERPGERTNNAWKDQNTGFYFAVVDAMLKTGFTEKEIGSIGGGNFARVFTAATK